MAPPWVRLSRLCVFERGEVFADGGIGHAELRDQLGDPHPPAYGHELRDLLASFVGEERAHRFEPIKAETVRNHLIVIISV